jgi:hypothetical protein
MVQWYTIPLNPAMPANKQYIMQRYDQTKLITVQYVTYKDDDTDVEVINTIMADVVNCDVPVVNASYYHKSKNSIFLH